MSLPKKNSRIITVDNVDYRWVSSGNDNGINIYVELAHNPGQLLCDCCAYECHAEGNSVAVTPAYIENIIKLALSKGWVPEENGPNFTMYKANKA